MAHGDPFQNTPDAAAYVARPATEAALESLDGAVRAGEQIVALSGPPGIGKTLLLELLANRCKDDFQLIKVPIPSLTPEGLFGWVVATLGLPAASDPRARIALAARQAVENKRPLLVEIDDACTLPAESVEALRTLHAELVPALHLVLVIGDDAAGDELVDRLGPAVKAVRLDSPMTAVETAEYLHSRLARAGLPASVVSQFDAAAIEQLQRDSGGVPARLHQLAELVLRPEEIERERAFGEDIRPETLAFALLSESESDNRMADWSDEELVRGVTARDASQVLPGGESEQADANAGMPQDAPGEPDRGQAVQPPQLTTSGTLGSLLFAPPQSPSAAEDVAETAAAGPVEAGPARAIDPVYATASLQATVQRAHADEVAEQSGDAAFQIGRPAEPASARDFPELPDLSERSSADEVARGMVLALDSADELDEDAEVDETPRDAVRAAQLQALGSVQPPSENPVAERILEALQVPEVTPASPAEPARETPPVAAEPTATPPAAAPPSAIDDAIRIVLERTASRATTSTAPAKASPRKLETPQPARDSILLPYPPPADDGAGVETPPPGSLTGSPLTLGDVAPRKRSLRSFGVFDGGPDAAEFPRHEGLTSSEPLTERVAEIIRGQALLKGWRPEVIALAAGVLLFALGGLVYWASTPVQIERPPAIRAPSAGLIAGGGLAADVAADAILPAAPVAITSSGGSPLIAQAEPLHAAAPSRHVATSAWPSLEDALSDLDSPDEAVQAPAPRETTRSAVAEKPPVSRPEPQVEIRVAPKPAIPAAARVEPPTRTAARVEPAVPTAAPVEPATRTVARAKTKPVAAPRSPSSSAASASAGRRPPATIAAPEIAGGVLPVTLRLESGRVINVDGVKQDTGRLSVMLLTPGPHRVTARSDDGKVYSRVIDVDADHLDIYLSPSVTR